MQKHILTLLLLFSFAGSFMNVFAEGGPKKSNSSEKYNPTEDILHHIADAHEWHFWGEGDNSVSLPLPVILYTEGKLDVFISSKFKHGHADVVVGERIYALDHGKIIEKSGLKVLDLSITKNVASMLFSVTLLFFLLKARIPFF